MKYLGLYDGHNSHACLLDENEIIASAEEERFSRIKNHDGRLDQNSGPLESIKYCLEFGGDIDGIAVALAEPIALAKKAKESFLQDINTYKRSERLKFLTEQTDSFKSKFPHIAIDDLPNFTQIEQEKRILKLKNLLGDCGLGNKPLHFISHHDAHISSAYFTSPEDDVIVFSMDGKGDDLCGMVALGNKGNIQVLSKINYIHSIGHFYSAITVVCGFRAIRHEGKITGLAALGEENEYLKNEFEKLFYFDSENGTIISKLADGIIVGPYPHTDFGAYIEKVSKICKGYSKEDIATNAQNLLEKIIVQWVKFWLEKSNKQKVLLAGGIFSNVKLNQRIAELSNVESIYVVPAMTDAGLGWGACFSVLQNSLIGSNHKLLPKPINNLFLGPSYSDKELLEAIHSFGLTFTQPDNNEFEVAKLLSKEKIVARFDGRMEYGPRSLGNRSILFSARHQQVNDQLNIQLNRSEFMPFAPASLIEHASELYDSMNIEKMKYTARYMTISVMCSDKMIDNSPATVHKDRTARPQLVDSVSNPGFHKILTHYHQLTGIASVGNTSYNLHEEPIVCNPQEAIRSYLKSELDALQLGKFLIEKQ